MNYQRLKQLIDSEAANATRAPIEVLTWLNEPSGQYRPRMVNARQLMANLGAAEGAAFLEKLEAAAGQNSAVKWGLKFLTNDGLDVGNAVTRGMLDQLASGSVITAAERDAVKALADEMTRAEAAGFRNVRLGDVEYARTLP